MSEIITFSKPGNGHSKPNKIQAVMQGALREIGLSNEVIEKLVALLTMRHGPIELNIVDGQCQVWLRGVLRATAQSDIIALCLAVQNDSIDEVWHY